MHNLTRAYTYNEENTLDLFVLEIQCSTLILLNFEQYINYILHVGFRPHRITMFLDYLVQDPVQILESFVKRRSTPLNLLTQSIPGK